VSQVDDRDLGGAAGASSTKAHLVASYRMSGGAATGLLAQTRSMTGRTDTTRKAWAAGWVTGEQAAVIGSAIDKLSATVSDKQVELAQLDLVEQAQTLTHNQLQHPRDPPPEAHRPPRTTTAPSTTPTATRVSHEVAVCGSVGARRW